MAKIKTWTTREKNIVAEEVKRSPDNIRNAFMQAAARLKDRTESAVGFHWYNSMKNDPRYKNTLNLVSSHCKTSNRKNSKKEEKRFSIPEKLLHTLPKSTLLEFVNDKISKYSNEQLVKLLLD